MFVVEVGCTAVGICTCFGEDACMGGTSAAAIAEDTSVAWHDFEARTLEWDTESVVWHIQGQYFAKQTLAGQPEAVYSCSVVGLTFLVVLGQVFDLEKILFLSPHVDFGKQSESVPPASKEGEAAGRKSSSVRPCSSVRKSEG
jgi:beta-glucanase (GH16 family)